MAAGSVIPPRGMLNGIGEKYNLRIEKVDITTSADLYELYRFDIPVLEFGDGTTLNSRIKKKDLFEKLRSNAY